MKEIIESISNYFTENTWWGDMLLIIAKYGIVAVSIIAPLIFGTDAQVERIKVERKELGIELSRVNSENNGYTITNRLQAGLLKEKGLPEVVYSGVPVTPVVKSEPDDGLQPVK